MRIRSETGFASLLSARLHETRSIFPWSRKGEIVAPVTMIPALATAPEAPLPPSKPFSQSEQQEADTLSQLRGALYPSEA